MCFSLFMVVLRALNTPRESTTFNAGDGLGDSDGGQARAILESRVSYAGDGGGDGDGGQASATTESFFSNTSDRGGDNCVDTPYHQSVSRALYNSIATFSTIIYFITIFH